MSKIAVGMAALLSMMAVHPFVSNQTLGAQQPTAPPAQVGACANPDSVVVVGNSRVEATTIQGSTGIMRGATLNYRDVQRAIKALYATGQFDDVAITCAVVPNTTRGVVTIRVKERPVLSSSKVVGVKRIPAKDVKERLEIPVGGPVDPSRISDAIRRADSLYESKGYYLARIRADSVLNSTGGLELTFNIDEGRRLAISGVRVVGNKHVPDGAVVAAMKSRPEGFFWWHRGEFKDEDYAGDLTERIPKLYGSRGYIDFRILRDTLIVDRERGKAMIELTVAEGPRYKVGSFEIVGNRRFPTDQLAAYYPFDEDAGPSLTERATGIFRGAYTNAPGTFDQKKWDEAYGKVKEAYADVGYIGADVNPVIERIPSQDSVRTVNLVWNIREGSPSIINRVDILGNDYTHEWCIRDQLRVIPGQVFNRKDLINSYQSISNLNFFESPMPEPDVQQSGEQGDVNVTFKVKEKRTGNINFGASMGQGTGLGGFIGLDQPNLLGRCKRAQLQWQFGKYINDFNLTYTDPSLLRSSVSGSVTAYHTRSRFRLADLGQTTRSGGQLQFGFPVPRSVYSRFYLSYGGERVKYGGDAGTLSGSLATDCDNCFRSTLGLTLQRDARFGMPFPMQGSMQSFNAQFNGGPLGGTAAFQRYTAEVKSYAPLGYIGANVIGSQPMTFVAGLSARAGTLFGNPGPFFYSQSFSLGGTQYGEPLRGYEEFAITPAGFDPSAGETSARRSSFGNAFFTGTGELGLRVSQSLYINTFFEAGNVWNHPRQFDPTRLFRSAGFGAGTMSPLGPLGIDLGYGFDKVDAAGRPAPGWKLHFRLGQFF